METIGTQKELKNQRKWTNSLNMSFIVLDVVCDNIIIKNLDEEVSSGRLLLYVLFFIFQILAAPIQTGVSDIIGRKKSLVVTLTVTFVSLVFMSIGNLNLLPIFVLILFTVTVKGVMGNTVPIVWSTIADIDHENERGFFAISEAFYAIGFLSTLGLIVFLTNTTLIYFLLVAFILAIFLCFKCFKDIKDLDDQNNKITFSTVFIQEPRAILDLLKEKPLQALTYSFLFLEVSLYSILIHYTDFASHGKFIVVSMMIGYLLGSAILYQCSKYNNHLLLRWGFIISTFSLVPYIVLSSLNLGDFYLLVVCYFIHTIGNAILSPTFLSEIGKGVESHKKGRRLGLMDSMDAIALAFATIVVVLLQRFNLSIFPLVIFSFITMILGWIFYVAYLKMKMGNKF